MFAIGSAARPAILAGMIEPNQSPREVWRNRIVWFALSIIGMFGFAVYNGVGKWGGDIVDAALRKWLPPADVVGTRGPTQQKSSPSEEELRRKQVAAWRTYAKCEEKRSTDLSKSQDALVASQKDADNCVQIQKSKYLFPAACSGYFQILAGHQAGLKAVKEQVCRKPS